MIMLWITSPVKFLSWNVLGSKLMIQPVKCYKLDIYTACFRGKFEIPLHSSSFLCLKLTFFEVPTWFFKVNEEET